ncbi:MAG: universal stress protein [Saprospiraceae bacterium]|nr:universal stress protein [Saprospiraceae bacterium]
MTRNILALVDFSDVTPRLVDKAGELAALYRAKCWLIHVTAPDPDFIGYGVGPQHERDHRAEELREEHRQLQVLKQDLEAKGVTCDALLIQGDLPHTVMEEADKLKADLIVLGSHGRSMLYELLVGSVCEYLLKHSTVPLIVVPSRQ